MKQASGLLFKDLHDKNSYKLQVASYQLQASKIANAGDLELNETPISS